MIYCWCFRNPAPPQMYKNPVNTGINFQPLVIAGFLNHQQPCKPDAEAYCLASWSQSDGFSRSSPGGWFNCLLYITLLYTNIAMEYPPFWWYLPGKMVIFMGYVSFREGNCCFMMIYAPPLLAVCLNPSQQDVGIPHIIPQFCWMYCISIDLWNMWTFSGIFVGGSNPQPGSQRVIPFKKPADAGTTTKPKHIKKTLEMKLFCWFTRYKFWTRMGGPTFKSPNPHTLPPKKGMYTLRSKFKNRWLADTKS